VVYAQWYTLLNAGVAAGTLWSGDLATAAGWELFDVA
jgi:hypothetical protein